MNKTPIKLKSCVVRLEQLPMTPKAQQLGLSAELRNVINERNMLTAKTKQRIISDLNELNKASQAEIARKNQAFQEILDTELAYVSQLEVLMKYFMQPIEERNLMNKKDFEIVFANIQTLYKVHEELVEELGRNLSSLSVAFLKLAPFFKLYSVYAYNYKRALEILDDLYKTNKVYANFINIQQTRPEVQTKLTSLLIAPIQRIPRYGLLLKQVLHNSKRSDPDYKGISESLKHVRSALLHINNHIENHERTKRLLELQTIIYKAKSIVIKPDRKLIKEGLLKTLGTKEKHSKVYLILFTDVLLICNCLKKNLALKHSLKVRYILPLHKCRIKEDKRLKIIEILCEGFMLNVYDCTGSKTDDWYQTIEVAIKDCINNRQTLKRDAIGSVRRLAATAKAKKRERTPDETTTTFTIPNKRLFNIKLDSENEIQTCKPPSPTTKGKSVHSQRILSHSDLASRNTFSSSSLFKLCSRKPIASTSSDNDCREQYLNHSSSMQIDSLYPLRHLSTDTGAAAYATNQLEVYEDKNVFVFGENNNNNPGFNISNIFTGIGGSIKRFFGYNNNNNL